MGDFGDKFRKAREKKELSLDDVSNVTKISARMLRAIEEEAFDDLPGGVFNKGFIRAYAKHLGLDAEEAVTDYLASLRQAQINANEVWETKLPVAARPAGNGGTAPALETKKSEPKPPSPKPQGPVKVEELPDLQLPRAEDVRPSRKEFLGYKPSNVPWKLVAAAALVVVLALSLWIRHTNRTRATVSPKAVAPVAVTQPAPAPAVASQPAPPPTSSSAENSSAQNVARGNAAPASSVLAASKPATQPAAANSVHATTSAAPVDTPKTDNSGEVTVKTASKPAPKTSEKPLPTFSVLIRANENSWISVTSDGQLVTQETLIAPAQTTVRGSREISIRVGNAAGVSFVWNGKEVPAGGAEAEVKNFVFDANGLRDSSAAGVP